MLRTEPSASLAGIASDILSYMEGRPDASETFEDIAAWSSQRHGTRVDRTALRDALDTLIANGLVESVSMRGNSYFRIKRKK